MNQEQSQNQEASAGADTSSGEGYNGWANYPTWCVNLWLSNDEALYREALVITKYNIKQQRANEGGFGRGVLAEEFKLWVRDDLTPDLGASFAADLLGWALDSVDWYEIADAWIEQVGEES